MQVKDKVILVTGGASGIGRRCAERLAEDGARVIAADIQAMADFGPQVTARPLDVTSEENWQALVAEIVEAHGRLDGLVNAAGVIRMGHIVDAKISDFRLMMSVNVEGTFLGCKYAMRAMAGAGTGSIVNISSSAGLAGSPGASAYCASKGAVRLMTKAVALEAIGMPSRIRVNSVHPAMTDTPMADAIVDQLGGTDDIREQMRMMMPSGRFATTDEIVNGIQFLLSDASSYMNGSELVIDNGFSAQ